MKSVLQLFFLIVGCCFIHSLSFGQDGIDKIYQIKFSGYKSRLSKEALATLNDVARFMKSKPDCDFKITGCSGTEVERLNVANWDRVNNTIIYLVEKKGIKAERFIFSYGEGKDCNTIDLQVTTDEKPTTDPPPHPNLRKKVTTGLVCPSVPASNY
jgi:hypothetical protein